MRVVSLLASATEILCALGLEDGLVGRSHECDYPESVKRLPVCTQPNFDTRGSSLQIDHEVQKFLGQAMSLYRVDHDLLRSLRPTHIVTQVQCDVCAVSPNEVQQAIDDLIETKPAMIALQGSVLGEVWEDVRRVSDALGVSGRGQELIGRLQGRIADLAKAVKAAPQRPRVACIEWIEPLMAAGNWVPELVELAGGENLFGLRAEHSPWLRWEELRNADPDVVAIFPCGFDRARTRSELTSLIHRSGWPDLKAVRQGRVYLMDGNQYFNRPGPRLVESLQILIEALHPGLLSFGHRGKGWEPL